MHFVYSRLHVTQFLLFFPPLPLLPFSLPPCCPLPPYSFPLPFLFSSAFFTPPFQFPPSPAFSSSLFPFYLPCLPPTFFPSPYKDESLSFQKSLNERCLHYVILLSSLGSGAESLVS